MVADASLRPLAGGASRLTELARVRRLMIYACPTPMNDEVIEAVLLAPPLVVTPQEVDEIVERLGAALDELEVSSPDTRS